MICKNAEGVRNIFCDGDPLDFTEDDISIQPVRFIREPLSNGKFSEKKTSPAIMFTIHVPSERRLKDLVDKCDVTLVVEHKNGRIFTLVEANMTYEEEPFDALTGKFRMKWIGRDCQETILQGTQAGTTVIG